MIDNTPKTHLVTHRHSKNKDIENSADGREPRDF
jgi:hypothetical protein